MKLEIEKRMDLVKKIFEQEHLNNLNIVYNEKKDRFESYINIYFENHKCYKQFIVYFEEESYCFYAVLYDYDEIKKTWKRSTKKFIHFKK